MVLQSIDMGVFRECFGSSRTNGRHGLPRVVRSIIAIPRDVNFSSTRVWIVAMVKNTVDGVGFEGSFGWW